MAEIGVNGETGAHVAVKSEVPIEECDLARDRFAVRIGDATLDVSAPEDLSGHAIAVTRASTQDTAITEMAPA